MNHIDARREKNGKAKAGRAGRVAAARHERNKGSLKLRRESMLQAVRRLPQAHPAMRLHPQRQVVLRLRQVLSDPHIRREDHTAATIATEGSKVEGSATAVASGGRNIMRILGRHRSRDRSFRSPRK